MLIAIIILFIFVFILYAKVAGLENALSNHLEEDVDEAHPKSQEESSFDEA
jgi:hypothetical protein